MKIIIEKNRIVEMQAGNLICSRNKEGSITYYASDRVDISDLNKDALQDFCKKNKGIAIFAQGDEIEVYNDPYCSIPIYMHSEEGGKLYISSSFEELTREDMHIDRVGLYETLLYESALHDRTIFVEIKQLPAAYVCKVNRETLKYEIASYWDFDIEVDNSITTEEQAVETVWNTLCNVFSAYKGEKLIMGISGGLDSRLSLCVMKEALDLQRVETFTFGHSSGILDYKLAKKVCRKLKMEQPTFYKLSGEAYVNSMDLPLKSGGGVGINHSHIYWCLRQMDTTGKTLISNYYSDAIMGYDCLPIQYEDVIENCAYYKKLHHNNLQLDAKIVREIEKDLRKITDRRGEKANFSCFDEYIYLVERNPKFHIKLSYIFGESVKTVLPYAEYSILHTMISLPLKYRYRKRIEHLILQKKFVFMRDISSTRYAGVDAEEKRLLSKLYYNCGFVFMRTINLCNSGLNVLSGGKLQLPNPFITENHLAVCTRYFSKEQRAACDYLHSCGYITEEQCITWKRRCKRTAEAQFVFGLIGIWTILKSTGEGKVVS